MLRLYKIITASLAIAGSLSLVVTGELNPVFIIPGLMLIPGYSRYIRGVPPVSRWLIAGLALLEIMVLAFDMMFVSTDFLVAIAHMTIVFQALKSFDMREPWDPLQVYFMSILQLIITSELSLSMLVGVFFAVFVVLFMIAMVFSHFMKEGIIYEVRFVRPMIFITIATLLLSVVMFVSIPRVSKGFWGRKASSGIRSVGFSEDVELGSFGRVLDDPSIVMRVEMEGAELPLYWRGATLDRFDGFRWSKSINQKRRIFKKDGRFVLSGPANKVGEEVSLQRIILEPLDTEVLFGLGEMVSIETRGWFLFLGDNGAVSMTGKNNRRISYTVNSIEDNGNRRVYERDLYLQLPGGMKRLEDLSDNVTRGSVSDYDKATSIMKFLGSGFNYSLSPPPPATEMSPMEWFLFGSREGYCEHFSTAMALMLRSQGVPARIVTGFMGGDENDLGSYIIVRQRNAHSWVEADMDGKWVRFDPTPVSGTVEESPLLLALDNLRMNWYRYVIGFSSYDQISVLSSFTMPVFETPDISGFRITVRPVYFAAIVVIAAVLILILNRGDAPRRRLSGPSRAYMDFIKALKKRGARISQSSTPEETAGEAERLDADPEKVSRIVSLYLEGRFGRRELTAEEREMLRRLSKDPFRRG